MQLYNFTEGIVHIERGERIGQAVFVKIEKGELEEVDEIESENRGGVGSTGF